MTAQNKNIPSFIRSCGAFGQGTRACAVSGDIGFEKSPPVDSVCRGIVCFVTLRVDDKRSELWEISPKNGKLLQDFTDSMSSIPRK